LQLYDADLRLDRVVEVFSEGRSQCSTEANVQVVQKLHEFKGLAKLYYF